MIHNQWYAVLESNEVKSNTILGVTRLGEKLAFWRDGNGKLSCLLDKCIHRGVALSYGEYCDANHIRCPFHGLEYDMYGKVVAIPANGRTAPVQERFKVRAYPVYERDSLVFVYWSEKDLSRDEFAAITPPEYFDDITADLQYATVKDYWKTHYSRCIENQLDAPHVPFVHYNTIGRGNRTVIDGPVVDKVSDKKFYVYVYMRKEDGTVAKKAAELPQKNINQFKLEFIFPNLWENHINDKIRILIAFAPVDENNTILYMRFYQNMVKGKTLGKLFSWLAMPFNLKVAHQDRHVVHTQVPKVTALQMGEELFPGDLPIIHYRKRREELKKLVEGRK